MAQKPAGASPPRLLWKEQAIGGGCCPLRGLLLTSGLVIGKYTRFSKEVCHPDLLE